MIHRTSLRPNRVADSDTRDLLNDYRQTLRGIQAAHAAFPPAELTSVSIGERTASLGAASVQTVSSLKDPRMQEAGLFSLSQTRYTQRQFDVQVLAAAPALDTDALARVSVLAGESVDVAWYEVRTSGGRSEVRVLDGVLVLLAQTDAGPWRTLTVRPSYAPAWAGPAAEAPAAFAARERAVRVRVQDVSMPANRAIPALSTVPALFGGVGMVLLALFLVCPFIYLCYIARRNYALNNDLPPPFFGGMRRFRGWG